MAVLFSDDFNSYADNTILNATADWACGSNNIKVTAGGVYSPSFTLAPAYLTGITENDYIITADMAIINAVQRLGLVGRFVNIDNYVFCWLRSDTGSSYKIQGYERYAAMTYTFLDQTITGLTNPSELKLEINGLTAKIYVNGVQYGTDRTLNSALASGYPGILAVEGGTSALIDNFVLNDIQAENTIVVTEPDDYQVFQRSGSGNRVMTFSGSYTGTPTAIQARIVAHGTDTAVTGLDWQTIDAAPSGNAWSGSLTIPAGGWYNIDVRWSNDTDVADLGTARFGVGDNFVLYGQSQMVRTWTMDTGVTTTLSDLASFVDTETQVWGQPSSTSAVAQFLNAIIGETGIPTCAIGAAASAQSISELSSGTLFYNRLVGVANEVGAAFVFYNQGTDDAILGTSKASYTSALTQLVSDLSDDLDESFTFGCSVLANTLYSEFDDAAVDTIRSAHLDYLVNNTGVLNLGTNQDVTNQTDGVHHDEPGQIKITERMALAALYALGVAAHDASGPALSSVQYDQDAKQVILTYAMDGGSALSVDSGSPTGIEIFGNGVAATPDSWSVSGTTITAQYTTLPALPITVRVAYGEADSATAAQINVRDNYTAYTTVGLPIPPTSATLTAVSADETAPVLTSPSATATSATTATGSVSTDDPNGTLYFLASTNATEEKATVKAALSQAVTTSGEQSISLSALNPGTTYYVHFVQVNGASLESASVVSTTAFTTDSVAVKGTTITLHDGTTPQASVADIIALWWDATTPSGAPDYSTTTASTDASGVLTLDLDAVTALSIGDSGFLLLYKLDATDHRDSLVFAGRVAVSDVS